MEKIKRWIKKPSLWIALIILIIIIGFFVFRDQSIDFETETVTQADLLEIVSGSGGVTAAQNANLSFEISGSVASILVNEGDYVEQGSVLASLNTDLLQSDLVSAQSTLLSQEAKLEELRAGTTLSDIQVTESKLQAAETKLANAQEALEETFDDENRKVRNAQENLLTTDLVARLTKGETEGSNFSFTPPTITGIYSGEEEGEYRITLYQSHAQSGYSFNISGLESGPAGTVSTTGPQPLGTKGLFIQFPENFARGGNIEWTVKIPNTQGSKYTSLKQAYENALENRDLAVSARERAVREAEDARDQVLSELQAQTTGTREEQIRAQEALVSQARAALRSAETRLEKARLRAPFAGVVNRRDISLGENVSPGSSAFSLTSDADFHLTFFVPEVDIANLTVGDKATVRFDAFPNQSFEAEVIFISSVAEERSGVSSFKTELVLLTDDPRIRVGMSSDIDIATESRENVLSVPGRAVVRTEDRTFVRVIKDGILEEREVELGLRGDRGRIEIISGLNQGEEVITFIRDADLERLVR